MAAFARVPLIIVGDSVVGSQAVSLCFFAFLSSVDDDCASVSPDVDDVAKITVRVVEGVADLLATLCCQAVSYVPLLIAYLFQFILIVDVDPVAQIEVCIVSTDKLICT